MTRPGAYKGWPREILCGTAFLHQRYSLKTNKLVIRLMAMISPRLDEDCVTDEQITETCSADFLAG